jgi:Family of unknown function (DUF5994)
MTRELYGRRLSRPVRFTLASELGDGLDGAWWLHTSSIARELPDLIDALGERLGRIIDIAVNWSALEGAPALDSLNRHGVAATPGWAPRHLPVMTISGSQARAHLLVVPCRTSAALAIMLLRQSADLPILHTHQNTSAFQAARTIVHSARTQGAASATPADASG